MNTLLGIDAAPEPVVPRRRGASKRKNWRRPGDAPVAVIRLELDLSDPQTRRRVEKQWAAVFGLRRALQSDARARVDAYHAARHERARDGAKTVRERLGLSRKGLERQAARHVEASGWLRVHVTKAVAQHVADEVWETVDRHLFPDTSGQRAGRPRVGAWWDFARIPGRARSHTKTQPTWETWRLVGSLHAHLDAYATRPGLTVAEAVLPEPGVSLLAQPPQLPAPTPPVKAGRADWWGYVGPLAVVFTGLAAADLVLPVRLPQGAGQFPRLAHFLADPTIWHKIDLCRVEDRHAPGGWRYYAHLMILGPGYTSVDTRERRAAVPVSRVAGVDGNVSNLAVVSMPSDSADTVGLHTTYATVTSEQRAAAERDRLRARRRQRALDRSRRATNPDQYALSKRQQARAERRAAAGLRAKAVSVPAGARAANPAGTPKQAYRKDALPGSYRRARADHATAARAAAQAKRARASNVAVAIVAAHGPHLVSEHVNMRAWARHWGRGVALFSPGMLVTALHREATACGGRMLRASTTRTALSQHCVCGHRQRKPLGQRTHICRSCGLVGDRDLVAAALAATVVLTDPDDPGTARIDPDLRAALQRRVGAQQEGLARSTATVLTPPRVDDIRASHPGSFRRATVNGNRPTPAQTPTGLTAAQGRRRSGSVLVHAPPAT